MRILGVPKPVEPVKEPSVYLLVRVHLAGDYAGSVDELEDQGYDSLRAANITCAKMNADGGSGPSTIVAVMFRREWDNLQDTPKPVKEASNAEAAPAEARNR